jgi:hypothetical protein
MASPPGQSASGSDIRQRIKEEMDKAKPGEVLAFDEDGFLLKQVVPPKQELAQADSLASFLEQYTRQADLDESNSRGGIKGTDPIASCDEPKGLPRPPECVVARTARPSVRRPALPSSRRKGLLTDGQPGLGACPRSCCRGRRTSCRGPVARSAVCTRCSFCGGYTAALNARGLDRAGAHGGQG